MQCCASAKRTRTGAEPAELNICVFRGKLSPVARRSDLTVGVLTHPQSNLADFYRELGDLFGVSLQPHNRWGGFKTLRERWFAHLESTRLRPVLLIDEAQEMTPSALSELRLLASARFDSQTLQSIDSSDRTQIGSAKVASLMKVHCFLD